MKNIIFYFTGTGNSLTVARELAKELGDSRIQAIGDIAAVVDADCESIGFVFPVYYWCLPLAVKRFVQSLSLGSQYIYGVATYASSSGTSFAQLERLVEESEGHLSAAYGVLMPGNYIVKYGAFPQVIQKLLMKRAHKKVVRISADVKVRRLASIPQGSRMSSRLEKTNLDCLARFGSMGANFVATNTCTGCGICEKVCPAENIKISQEDKKPVWGNACEQCVACIQWCPAKAIEYGNVTANRKRYHHLQIEAADIFRRV